MAVARVENGGARPPRSDFARVGASVGDERLDPPVRIMLRPVGSPLPLGFFAFAVGSFLFTAFELGWVAQSQARPLSWIMLVFVVPLQLIGSIVSFMARDAGSATALGLFAMTWASVAVVGLTSTAPRTPVLGVFMLAMCAVILAFGATSVMGKPLLGLVSFLACIRFAMTGVYQIHGGTGWEHTSGWLGLPLCAAAFYLALALMLEDVQHHTVLPIGRRGPARGALERPLGDQVASVEREAGVRDKL
jgi:uncharacterized protein